VHKASVRLAAFITISAALLAQPKIAKVEPPDWWTPTKTTPLRLLIRGEHLERATLTVAAPLKASNLKINARGTYLLADLSIPETARPGEYPLTVTAGGERAQAPFTLHKTLAPQGRFQGFSPRDVIYLIMPDRFASGTAHNDPLTDRAQPRYYHGGDFLGIERHLDYLQSLGVTALWINPWYDNYNGLNEREKYDGKPITDYHGYGAVDFYGVEEHFGTMAGLQQLVEQAHARGLKIIQDQVANHTGPYHPWTKDAPTPTWYNGTPASHLANDFITWPLMDPYASAEVKRKVLEGWFIDILPDMNQNDADARRYLIQNSLWWVGRTGLDAIRQDTLPYAPRDYWRDWTAALKREFPRVNVVGEVFDGDPAFTSFFQGGAKRFDGVDSGVQSVFDFPLYFALRKTFGNGEALRNLPQTLAHDRLYTHPELLVTFLGLHDVARFVNEPKASVEELKLAFTTLFTSRGVPMIYYGDEIGLAGGGDPDNRRDFPGGWAGDSQNAFLESGRTPAEQEVFAHVQHLIALRKSDASLAGDRPTVNLYSAEQQWAFLRGSTVVLINNDAKPAAIELKNAPNGEYADGLGGLGSVTIRDGMYAVTLPARSASVLMKKGPK